ncbi:hypothetical protein WN944_010966 [Citrus x changshan-huyou]|uniref:Uncharacterized protein n=2 Tax=Citrus TaxID=2706 RepID=A0A2H5QHE0_CITUN|nr:hypothetical protein CUMW_230160 [Citrus unshiu]
MNSFQRSCQLLALVVLIFTSSTPRIEAGRWKSFSSPSSRTQQVYADSSVSVPFDSARPSSSQEFESEKRRVPTGSNPLHNKR